MNADLFKRSWIWIAVTAGAVASIRPRETDFKMRFMEISFAL